ncbi:MAG: S66 peptidase family protein [Planctomycetota bacterium]
MASVPICLLDCPAYGLQDQTEVELACQRAGGFCAERGWRLTVAPELAQVRGRGHWHSRSDATVVDRVLTADVWWPARGGYGCLALADALRTRDPQRLPLLIGYSDITVLHALWWQHDCTSVYGPMPAAACPPGALRALARALDGDAIHFSARSQSGVTPLHPGSCQGPCFAACLSVLAGLVGTSAMPALDGCLLALEDIDERPYRVDRALWQLARAGCLTGVRGLIWGVMPHENPPGYAGETMHAVLQRWARALAIPAIAGLDFGHSAQPLSLVNGRQSVLAVDAADWSLEQTAVKPLR